MESELFSFLPLSLIEGRGGEGRKEGRKKASKQASRGAFKRGRV